LDKATLRRYWEQQQRLDIPNGHNNKNKYENNGEETMLAWRLV
jgi:hypothetical protein